MNFWTDFVKTSLSRLGFITELYANGFSFLIIQGGIIYMGPMWLSCYSCSSSEYIYIYIYI